MADLADLFDDIDTNAPCGTDLEYDNERIALGTAIQGTPEDQFSGQKYEPPNWREVQKQSLALLKKSKDLQLILYLIRCLIHLEGLTGIRDGLLLLEHSVNRYWDTVYPLLDPDDNDPTQRLNILEELCSRELVINPLSLCFLVENKAIGRFSLRDILYASDKLSIPDGLTKPDLNIIKAAFNEADKAALQLNHTAILESADLLQKIEDTVSEKVSGLGNGVNFEAIKAVFKDLRFNIEEFGCNSFSVETTEEGEEAEKSDPDTNSLEKKPIKSTNKAVGDISSRQDVIKALDLICKYYAEYEPSSPVPILLYRAKNLVTSNFMEVVKNLLPDAVSQIEFIKGPEPGGE